MQTQMRLLGGVWRPLHWGTSLVVMTALIGTFVHIYPSYGAEFTCTAGDVDCLIEAIHTANATGETNTITLAAGTYRLTAVDNTTDGPNGIPSVTSPLTLRGAGAACTIIERAVGAPPFRLLHVAPQATLTLEGLTLRGGGLPDLDGGGIYNRGTLTLTDAKLNDNAANDGGGIYQPYSEESSGTLTITRSLLSGNIANGGGGGISASGTLTITDSTLDGNMANTGGGGIGTSGGGSLTITNSTLSGNMANGSGGGINAFGSFGMTITNSTLYGNMASGSGGGISLAVSFLTLTNSTLSGNMASQGGGISIAGGGTVAPASSASLRNTILGQNTVPPTGTGPDCVTGVGPSGNGQATSHGHNLIGDSTGCNITWAAGDLTGNPGLGDFTDTGVPGQGYVPLLPISQAIDAGDPETCPAADQLGQLRVSPCDIGAVEFAPVTVTLGLNQSTACPGDTLRVTLGIRNWGPTVTADAYLGILLSDGVSVLFVTSLVPVDGVVTRLDGDTRTFAPLAPAYAFPAGEDVTVEDFFVYTLTGEESPGAYAIFTLLTTPGAFADGQIDPGDLLGLTLQPFTVSP